jgi:hypothetical protein
VGEGSREICERAAGTVTALAAAGGWVGFLTAALGRARWNCGNPGSVSGVPPFRSSAGPPGGEDETGTGLCG